MQSERLAPSHTLYPQSPGLFPARTSRISPSRASVSLGGLPGCFPVRRECCHLPAPIIHRRNSKATILPVCPSKL